MNEWIDNYKKADLVEKKKLTHGKKYLTQKNFDPRQKILNSAKKYLTEA